MDEKGLPEGGQHSTGSLHQRLKMPIRSSRSRLQLFVIALLVVTLAGCISPKTANKTPTLLKTENAGLQELMAEVNRFARVDSMRAKMDLKFEDNSFAQFGSKEVYRSADGEVVVQRPASIFLKVQVPVIKTDVAQMTSDGQKFRVAILQDGGSGKYKKFVKGTNSADYSSLQNTIDSGNGENGKVMKENVNAFSNLRPQHFTDAMLVRPTGSEMLYTQSTTFLIEEDETADKKSPLRKVNRGYYLLDEYLRRPQGDLVIARRFWFDRVGGIRLARQQIFDARGEIESDIVYGAEGNLTDTAEYTGLPLRITVTRPQEKYSMRLTYQLPDEVKIGIKYPESAFVLVNTWKLEEVDLDEKLRESNAQKPAAQRPTFNSNTTTRLH